MKLVWARVDAVMLLQKCWLGLEVVVEMEEMDSGQVLRAEMPELGHGLMDWMVIREQGTVEENSKFFALINFLCTLFKY